MKKNMLYGALFNLICTQVQALQATDTSSTTISIGNKIPPVKKITLPESTKKKQTNNNTTQQTTSPALRQAPQVPQNAQTTQHLPSGQQKQADIIDCDYKIPVETTKIDQEFVLNWAEHAAVQSFDFNSASMDTELEKLQSCYTENGWVKFKTALHSSGNIEVIKTQQLAVSSQIDGHAQLIESKEDYQWKITLPLKVVYRSDQERVIHFLNIYLTIGRKITGELGIMQMIATPRFAPLSQKAASIEEATQNIYLFLAQKNTETHDAVHKTIIPFFVSLFPKNTRTSSPNADSISSQAKQLADLTQKLLQNQQIPPISNYKTPAAISNRAKQLADLTQKLQQNHQAPILICNYKMPTAISNRAKQLADLTQKIQQNHQAPSLICNYKMPTAISNRAKQLADLTQKIQQNHQAPSLICNYKTPTEIAKRDQTIILNWAHSSLKCNT